MTKTITKILLLVLLMVAFCHQVYAAGTSTSRGTSSVSSVDLSNATGTLATVNGGTGTATTFTQGSVIFAGASGVYSQDNSNFFYDATNHRLGIGIAPGSFALNVNGAIQAGGININQGGTCVGNTTNGQMVCFGAGTGGADNVMLERAASGTVNIGTDTAGAQRFNVIGSASVSTAFFLPGIATSSAAQTGTLCGGAAGNVTLDTTTTCLLSSLRFKKDIEPLDVGLAEVMKMKPVSFVYKENFDDANLAKRKVGLIAEDVDLIDKRLVAYDKDGVTPHSIMYAEYTAVLTKAIQELQDEHKNQQKEIDDLHAQLHMVPRQCNMFCQWREYWEGL